VLACRDWARANNDVASPARTGAVSIILIVGVSVYYYVRAKLEASSQASHKTPRETLVTCVAYHVVDSGVLSDPDCIVAAASAYYQPFHVVETRDFPRQFSQCDGECLCFVATGIWNMTFINWCLVLYRMLQKGNSTHYCSVIPRPAWIREQFVSSDEFTEHRAPQLTEL